MTYAARRHSAICVQPDPAILTIAIPTYNRAAKLEAQLARLVPQLTPEVRLCVYDNASPDHTREVVAKYPGIFYYRAATNCGAGRNFFRGFEECATEWLWVLSDDDLVTTSAVVDLLGSLRQETCDFVHIWSWMSPYERDTVVSDLPSLFQHANMRSLTWITAGIYRISAFRPLFRLYNEGISTWGPHLIMILSLIESGKGRAHLTPIRLTIITTTPGTWSTLDGLLRLSHVPEYLVRPAHQQLVAESIFIEFFNDYMLMGLRESAGSQEIQRWQRVYAQARNNLKTYQARGIWHHVARNWYRTGQRRLSLRMAQQACMIRLLNWCPVGLVHVLVRLLPLDNHLKDEYYGKRNEYVPSA